MQDNYIDDSPEFKDYICDPHVLTDKQFVLHIPGCEVDEMLKERPYATTWYPYVNSYYQYAEDYDAVNRVSHLLLEELEAGGFSVKDGPREIIDAYTEDEAQLRFLRTAPINFIILGKPAVGGNEVGKLLADFWNCECIHPLELIEEEIRSGTRAGMCIEFNLRCGRAVSVDVLMRLLEKKLSSKSVQHRGFVLCGFPLVANDLFSEDPICSESAIFNVNEIFEELFENALDVIGGGEIKNVSRASSIELAEEEMEPSKLPEVKAEVDSTTDEICFRSNFYSDHKEQMNFIFSLIKDRKYLIVYMKCNDEEVVNIRRNNRCDAYTLDVINIEKEKSDHVDYSPHYSDQNQFASKKLLKLPRDFPANVSAQLDAYRFESEQVIEKQILLHDPDQIIKLDARLAPHRMYQALRLRLKILPYVQSISPEHLIQPTYHMEFMGEGQPVMQEKVNKFEGLEPIEWFKQLRTKQNSGPLYKWTLSKWDYRCPISMFYSDVRDGLPEYSVHFMNHIFFLNSEDFLNTFLLNPRPFLQPPFPRHSVKFFLIGPKLIGKTAFAECLKAVLHLDIIKPQELYKIHMNEYIRDMLNDVENQAKKDAIYAMKQIRRENYENSEEIRINKLNQFTEDVNEHVKIYLENFNIVNKFNEVEPTSLPIPKFNKKPDEVVEAEAVLKETGKYLGERHISLDNLTDIVDNKEELEKLAPEILQPPLVYEFELISYDSPFVVKYVNSAILNAKKSIMMGDTDVLNYVKIIQEAIMEVERRIKSKECNGWVVDSVPAKTELLEKLYPEYMPQMFFLFKDNSENFEFLKNKYQSSDETIDNADEILKVVQSYGVPSVSYPFDEASYLNLDEDEYFDHLESFIQDYDDILEFCNNNNLKFQELVITDKTLKDIFDEAMNISESEQTQAATVFTPTDRVLELDDYGERVVEDEEMAPEDRGGGDNSEKLKEFQENRRLGDTARYCPVTYKLNNVLWEGKEEYAAKYLDKLYFFSNEEKMQQFIQTPAKFVFKEVPEKIPPQRICISGLNQSGKTTLAKAISRCLGLYYGNYEKLLKTKIDDIAYNNYLTSDTPIDEEILFEILSPYWFKEPKSSKGFVLDGFPKRPSDVNFMCKYNTIPDLLINLTCPISELNTRLLQKLLEEWQIQIDADKAKEANYLKRALEDWEEMRALRREELLESRRDQRYNERANMGEEAEDIEFKKSTVSYKSFEEAEDLKMIENILDQEFPKPDVNTAWETLEMATERLGAALDDINDGEPEFLNLLYEHCLAENIKCFDINAGMNFNLVYFESLRQVLPLKYRSNSIFERCYDISVDLAEKLLNQGYYFLSRFGKSCPVQIYENKNPFQLYMPLESQFQLFPIIHRQHIYFLAGPDNRKKFKEDTLKYVNQTHSYLPLVQKRIAIIGPPKCGKTTLSERIQTEYALKHISIGKSIRYVVKFLRSSVLAQKVEDSLQKGESLDDELAILCVEAYCFENKGIALGFVFDGFPTTTTQIKELAKVNLIPHVVINLVADLPYILLYMDVFTGTHKPEYSKKFITHRYDEFKTNHSYCYEWLQRDYQNVFDVTVDPSKWKDWYTTNEIITKVFLEISAYYINCKRDMVLQIGKLLVTPLEFLQRQTKEFRNYCPCCLHINKALTLGGVSPDRKGLVQYQEYFYWICPLHLQIFMNDPTEFLPPKCKNELPSELPKRIVLESRPDNLYENGYCIVCYFDNIPERHKNEGSLEYAVEYLDYIYLFDSEECLQKFMSQPTTYYDVEIPTYDLPPDLNMQALPTLGLLEQYDADLLVRALISLNNIRPSIPGLDPTQSSLIYLGMYLKINNPNTPAAAVKKYEESERAALHQHNTLLAVLAKLKKTLNPYLYYENPLPQFDIDRLKKKNVESSTSNISYLEYQMIEPKDSNSSADTTEAMKNIINEIVNEII